MAFLETPRLDPRITSGARCEEEWSRTKAYTFGGKLQQNFNWAGRKLTLDLSYGGRTAADYRDLVAMFHVVMANAHEGFRAKNWADFLLTQTNSTLTFLTGSTWQIQRKSTAGAGAYLHNITKPISPVLIHRTRAAVVTTASATINYTTGIATVSGHVAGDTYTASGEFDTPVTFVGDKWVGSFKGTSDELWIVTEPILLEEV